MTTLRVYGLRPSGKTKGSTASRIYSIRPTNCVLATLRSDARNYLRSAGQRSSTYEERFVTHTYIAWYKSTRSGELTVRLRDEENKLKKVKMECRYPPQILLQA